MIMDRLESPPPANMFRIPKNWLLERNRASSGVLMPGMGTAESSRKIIRANKTNSTLLRRFVSVQINFILFQKFCIFLFYDDTPTFETQTFSDFGKFFLFARSRRRFIFPQHEGFFLGLKLVTPVLGQLLNDITKLRSALVAGAGGLSLPPSAGGLGMLAPSAHQPVFFILMDSF